MATIPTMKVKKKQMAPSLASPKLLVLVIVAIRTIPSSGKTTEQIPVINAPEKTALPTAELLEEVPYPPDGGYPPPGGVHC